jgi:pyruvate dehydrogenase (quinone)
MSETLGFLSIRLDHPDQVAGAWEQALAADRPVVIDAHTDPEVPPLPPHITLQQARHFLSAALQEGHSGRKFKQAFQDSIESFIPHRHAQSTVEP